MNPSASFRFSPEELELLDSWVVWRSALEGRRLSRVGLIRELLRVQKIPQGDAAGAKRLRDAHQAVFG